MGCLGFSLRKPTGGIRPSKDICSKRVLLYQYRPRDSSASNWLKINSWKWQDCTSLPHSDSRNNWLENKSHVRKWPWFRLMGLAGHLFPNLMACHWKTWPGPTLSQAQSSAHGGCHWTMRILLSSQSMNPKPRIKYKFSRFRLSVSQVHLF